MKDDLLEIMHELNYQCEYCPFRERCAKERCVYFRIEKIVNKLLDEKGIHFIVGEKGYGKNYHELEKYTKEELIKICLTLNHKNNDLIKEIKNLEKRINKTIGYMDNTFDISSVKDMYDSFNMIEKILKGVKDE